MFAYCGNNPVNYCDPTGTTQQFWYKMFGDHDPGYIHRAVQVDILIKYNVYAEIYGAEYIMPGIGRADIVCLETGEISDKLGRGRHTTRQAEIFHIGNGLVIDTAGFSSIDFAADSVIFSSDLEEYFPEIRKHIGECKFTGCSHLGDKGCKISELVDSGEISKSRYESYCTFFDEQKNLKKWNV